MIKWCARAVSPALGIASRLAFLTRASRLAFFKTASKLALIATTALVPLTASAEIFDRNWYLAANPDVLISGMDPLVHYRAFGWREGRRASSLFDTGYYLRNNPDVAAANIDPLLHYELWGWREGRNPNDFFSTSDYLALNPDVAVSGANPLEHYRYFGRAQARRFTIDPSRLVTAEYNRNPGLAQIGAAAAYARGATGAGVLVGVIDSGIDFNHPDLRGQIGLPGWDYGNERAGGWDVSGHGTAVAGIIAGARNGTEMHGVAWGASLVPYNVFLANGSSVGPDKFARAFLDAAATGAKVINASYTKVVSLVTPATAIEFNAIKAAADAGAVIVFAAGNAGLPHPQLPALLPYVQPRNHDSAYISNIYGLGGVVEMNDWSSTMGKIITVVAVDGSNQIASFSNRCGVAASWCLAAPGVGVPTTANGGGYALADGTSFAAPHVAGAAAVLRQLWPHLSVDQVVALLLNTATPLGSNPGNDPVYGRGLVNLDRATRPQGAAMVALGDSVTGPTAALASSYLQLSPAFGSALAGLSAPVGFLDGYGRDYILPMSNLVAAPRRKTSLSGMLGFGRAEPGVVFEDKTMRLAMTAAPPPRPRGPADTGRNDDSFEIGSLAMTQTFKSGSRLHFAYGMDPRENPGLRDANGLVPRDLPLGEGIGIPYLAMAQDRSMSMVSEMRLSGTGLSLRSAAFLGAPAASDPLKRRRGSGIEDDTRGAVAELRYGGDWGGVGVTGGFLSERNGPLGLMGDGAFSMNKDTPTFFTGINAQVALTGKVQLFGSYHVGLSQPGAVGGNSLLTGMSDVRSSSFSLGVSGKDVFQEKDRLGLVFSQPLRVDSAKASFSLPLGRDEAGRVQRYGFSQDLRPEGRELDLQLFYHAEVSDRTAASFGLFTRFQPDHRTDASNDNGIVARLRHKF